tara:strand:+ start:210 stop:2339 length:2130 start_codon:yes stop_codon:yes gene_type:complete
MVKSLANQLRSHKLASLMLLVCALGVYFQGRMYQVIADDAYISFTYAKHLVAGEGLVFNPGERVEGYTNFLWTLAMALPHLLAVDVALCASWLGFFISLGTLLVVFLLSRQVHSTRPPLCHVVAPVLLAANGAFTYWTFSGMETAIFTFLIALGVYQYGRHMAGCGKGHAVSLVWGLASLTRPEGIFFFALTSVHRLATQVHRGRFSLRNFAVWIVPFAALVIPHFAFRYIYYGHLFPNTFFAKRPPWEVALKFGMDYTGQYLADYCFWGLGLLVPMCLFMAGRQRGWGSYIALLIWGHAAYVTLVGGDVLGANRFFVPILPLLYLTFQEGLYRILHLWPAGGQGLKTRLAPPLALLLCTATCALAYATYSLPRPSLLTTREFNIHHNIKLISLADYIDKSSPPVRMVAAGAIGIPRYFAAAHVIDLIGLTDSTIAHHPQHIPGLKSPAILRKHNTQYVLDRRPDMIFFITGVKPQTAAEKALFLSRRFRQGYYLSHFREGLKAFARRPDYDFGQPDDIFPNTAFVEYYIAGLNALSRDDSTAVVDNFTRCIETGPRDFSYPHLQLGAFYFDNREPARAKPHFARATRIDPYNVGAHAYLALVELLEEVAPAGALALAQKAVSLSPQSHVGRFAYGLSLLKAGRLDEAVGNLKMAIDLKGPNTERAWVFLGQAHYQKGELEQARKIWEFTLQNNPELEAPRRFLKALPR